MAYLGPAITSQGYRMWNSTTRQVIETRNVKFLEEGGVNDEVTLPFDIVDMQPLPQEPAQLENQDKEPIDLSNISGIFQQNLPSPIIEPLNNFRTPPASPARNNQQPPPPTTPQAKPPVQPPVQQLVAKPAAAPPVRRSSRPAAPNHTFFN